MADTIQDDKVVLFNYTLTNDAGETLDSSEGDPLPYLHGAQNIVPGLEKEMSGKSEGDSFSVTVPPEEAYGVPQGEPVQAPRDSFPPDVDIEDGMPFTVETERGKMMTFWVVDADDETVTMSQNHPLAGETLHFDIEVVRIRDATEEEIAHGHPHGPDGHSGHH